jgi:hypothetical protein
VPAKRKPHPSDDIGQQLPLLARAAADKRRVPKEPLSRSAALAEAPWSADMPPAWQRPFREAYADRLAERGLADGKARQGASSKAHGVTKLMRRQMQGTKEEFAEHDAKATAAGLSWSTWARRKLA